MRRLRSASGFSMIELLVATTLLMIVSAIVMSAIGQLHNSQRTISNRTAMHSGIRGATELLQQEIGQAGLIALPGTPSLSAAVAAAAYCDGSDPSLNAVDIGVSSADGMFQDMVLTTLDGNQSETVKVASINTATPSIHACFTKAHVSGTKVQARGGFATGIIPNSGITNHSDGYVLKMYGDIDGDGNLKYVEYTCDPWGTGNLYRQVMDFDASSKPLPGPQDILLTNLAPNPGDPECFKYQTETYTYQVPALTQFTFVVNVAVTLTVETEQIDPLTNTRQKETKALLNVSPRNVVDTWRYASNGYTYRIQSTPLSVLTLLAPAES